MNHDVLRRSVCPQCGGRLTRVNRMPGAWVNADQFASMRAGDWYCPACPDNGRGKSGLCYWWHHELPAVQDYQI